MKLKSPSRLAYYAVCGVLVASALTAIGSHCVTLASKHLQEKRIAQLKERTAGKIKEWKNKEVLVERTKLEDESGITALNWQCRVLTADPVACLQKIRKEHESAKTAVETAKQEALTANEELNNAIVSYEKTTITTQKVYDYSMLIMTLAMPFAMLGHFFVSYFESRRRNKQETKPFEVAQ